MCLSRKVRRCAAAFARTLSAPSADSWASGAVSLINCLPTKKCMQSFTEECRRTAAQYESNPRSSKRRSCQQSTAMPATTGGFNRSMQQRDEIAQLESRIAAYSLVVR